MEWTWLIVAVVLAGGAIVLQTRNMGNIMTGRVFEDSGSFLRTGALTGLLALGAVASFVVFIIVNFVTR